MGETSPAPNRPDGARRILAFCITELNVGGAERILTELAVRLDKTRFDVAVYSLQPRPVDDAASCVPTLEAAGIPVRFLDMRGAVSFFSALRCLRRMLAERKPDLLLSFLFHANLLGRLAARTSGVPHVVSGIRVAEKQASWHRLLDRGTSRFVEKYVCVSRGVAEFSRKVVGLPESKLTVIPNGVDIPAGQPAVERQNRIVFVGRLDRQKGPDWLLDTVSAWLPRLPDWELWIVGDGPERQNLTRRLATPEFDALRDRIRLTGRRPDVDAVLAASRLLVLPSRWEGMPNVVLQAMAAGIPVVATDVEGVAELLGPAAAEQTCPFGDDAEFAARLLNLARNPDRAAELGDENRRRAAESFSTNLMVRRYEELFDALIGTPFLEKSR